MTPHFLVWTCHQTDSMKRLHDCSPIPVFCFLYSKILPVTKMRLNVCFNEMALFGPFAALIEGCRSYEVEREVSPQEEMANPRKE